MIRPYKINDRNSLIKILRANTPKYFAPSEEKDFEIYLDDELEDYFVVEVGNEVIGCGGINYSYPSKEAFISWDLIHPDHHFKGFGNKLLDHRIRLIKNNKKINTIIVRTSQHTDKFYEKGGFKLEFTKKDFWAEGIDLYHMILPIKD